MIQTPSGVLSHVPRTCCRRSITGAVSHGASVRNRCKARAHAVEHLGHVFRVAPIRLLHQQSPHVLLPMPLRLLPPKERSKLFMKGGKRRRHPRELGLIHPQSSWDTHPAVPGSVYSMN